MNDRTKTNANINETNDIESTAGTGSADVSEHCTFRVLQGGLSEKMTDSKKVFADANITDTRLMGVTVLYVHWLLPDNLLQRHFFQFFRFDFEEYGMDEYHSLLCSSLDEAAPLLEEKEMQLCGGLGAKKNMLTEREARFLVQSCIDFNRSRSIKLPMAYEEISFLLSPHIEISDVENYVLMCKQSPMLSSPYQVINYFIMRCIGKDFDGAKFLTKNYVRTELFAEFPAASLLRNSIDEDTAADSGSNSDYVATDDDKAFGTFKTRKAYMCESLIEFDGKYYILVSRVSLEQLNVVAYERISAFRITLWEASLMLTTHEYICLYESAPDICAPTRDTLPILAHSTLTEYENGRMFMIFQAHNDHVASKLYRMSDDVVGVLYVLDNDRMLLASTTIENQHMLERSLAASSLAHKLLGIAKYEFDHPILANFINSGFDDFEDFVQMVTESDDD